jgi:hypothetical protein
MDNKQNEQKFEFLGELVAKIKNKLELGNQKPRWGLLAKPV